MWQKYSPEQIICEKIISIHDRNSTLTWPTLQQRSAYAYTMSMPLIPEKHNIPTS